MKTNENMTLERTLRIYKATYDVTDTFFLDLLGPMTRTTWKRIRDGKSEMSLRQAASLAHALGMTIDELYELSPSINHAE